MKVKQNIEWLERVIVNILAGRLDVINDVEIYDDCILLQGKKRGVDRVYRINNTGKVTRIKDRFIGRTVKLSVVNV